ncbi:MAG: hypothetical protein ACRCVN_07100 [Spirochaetia bacterium]
MADWLEYMVGGVYLFVDLAARLDARNVSGSTNALGLRNVYQIGIR